MWYRSQRVILKINTNSGETLHLRCCTLPSKVTSTTPMTDWRVFKKRWFHLANPSVGETGGRVDILIGNDYFHLTTPHCCYYEPVRLPHAWMGKGYHPPQLSVSILLPSLLRSKTSFLSYAAFVILKTLEQNLRWLPCQHKINKPSASWKLIRRN